MVFSCESAFFFSVSLINKIRSITRIVGNINVFYGLYEIVAGEKSLFTVIAAEGNDFVHREVESVDDGLFVYELISSNGVDTASFNGIMDDYLYAKALNNIL